MDVGGFLQRLQARQSVVGIVGLGYVGLPLMLSFTGKGLHVVGFDIDPDKVAQLKAGKSYIRHIADAVIDERLQLGRLTPTCDFAQVSRCDAILLCIPTPLGKNHEPDMSFIEGTATAIAPHLKRGQLVVLESTTYPGTTEGLLRRHLEAGSSLRAGEDFFLAFSPEREDPGNLSHASQTIPKVVGGLTPACREVAAALYGAVLAKVVPVSSLQVAEMTKLLENIFRSVNIAMVNELKMLCDAMKIDVWEVIEAAATKPFGFMPFYPGPGLGGHCIPIDPFYLSWKAREYEQPTRFIELAGEINTRMPNYVLERIALALNAHRKPVNGSRVLVLGVAYKRDVDDMRESPALRLIDLLQGRGAEVRYHDPYIPQLPKTRAYDLGLRSVPLDGATLRGCDVAVIVTDHTDVDYTKVVAEAPLVVDTRNATRSVSGPRERIVKA